MIPRENPAQFERAPRELSGCGSQTMPPHAAYMKITTVELEKLRLNKARQHALRRVDEIDDRLSELDAKKAALRCSSRAGAACRCRRGERWAPRVCAP